MLDILGFPVLSLVCWCLKVHIELRRDSRTTVSLLLGVGHAVGVGVAREPVEVVRGRSP